MPLPRDVYGKTLVQLGRENPNIVVLDADLAVSTKTQYFAREFPDRFFYAGVAEANMMGVAAGLALGGKLPFASTFSIFATARAFDQLRQSIALPRLNVKIVATHGGITVGEDGPTHHAIQDLALACSLPNMTVVVPADATSTESAVRAAAAYDGPVFVRLPRSDMPDVYPEKPPFEIGRAITLRQGKDTTIIGIGRGVSLALEAAELLALEGIACRIIDMHTLAPIDRQVIVEAAEETGSIVTVEEHIAHGGLGSIVARIVAETRPVPLRMVALEHRFFPSGKAEELLRLAGLTPERVAAAVHDVLATRAVGALEP